MKLASPIGALLLAAVSVLVFICTPAFADTVAAIAPLADASAAAVTPAMDPLAAAKTYLATPAMITMMCSFLSAVLPQGEPRSAWGFIRMVIDFAAMNFGNAKNAPRV